MTFKQILILIVSALLLYFGYKYYKNEFCPDCCEASVNAGNIGASSAMAATGPLVFNWNSAEAIAKEDYAVLKSEIFAGQNKGDVLEITGQYYPDEKNDTAFENLGYARANAIGEMLKRDNPSLIFKSNSELVDMISGAEANEFSAMSYRWITNKDSKKETVDVADTGDARILFPYNSSDKIDSPEVEAYLNSLAKRLKNNPDERVHIVGHTDSRGEPGPNRRLSERRAKKIRDILKKKGVPNRQIKPRGRGEADPVAPNNTDASRQLNRRVEITIK